MNHYTRSKH